MRKWLLDIISENAKKLIGGGVAAFVLASALAVWTIMETRVKNFIIAAVAEKMLKEDEDDFSKAFKTAVARVRKSEAGSISVGSFLLTPTNRSFTLYVYFPDGYNGKIFYSLKGDLIPEKRYVVLATPEKKPEPLILSEDAIILERYFRATSAQAAMINDYLERGSSKGPLKSGLRPITFQLEGADTDEQPTERAKPEITRHNNSSAVAIEISYVTFVAPAIRMNQ